MSDYQPKVGDKVMVGGHGPYWIKSRAIRVDPADPLIRWHVQDEAGGHVGTVPSFMLTPALEPDLPTERGALIVDGDGRHRFLYVSDLGFMRWIATGGPAIDVKRPVELSRPITILDSPAEAERLRGRIAILTADRQSAETEAERLRDEVERVRATAEAATADLIHARRRADELQRRINIVVGRLDAIHMPVKEIIAKLRGEMSCREAS